MEGVLSEGVLTFVQRGFCPRTLSYNLWPSYPVFIPLTTVVGFHSGCVILSLRPCLILPRNTLFNANVSFNAILQQKWSVSGLLDTDKGFDFPLSSAPSPLSPVPLPLARLARFDIPDGTNLKPFFFIGNTEQWAEENQRRRLLSK